MPGACRFRHTQFRSVTVPTVCPPTCMRSPADMEKSHDFSFPLETGLKAEPKLKAFAALSQLRAVVRHWCVDGSQMGVGKRTCCQNEDTLDVANGVYRPLPDRGFRSHPAPHVGLHAAGCGHLACDWVWYWRMDNLPQNLQTVVVGVMAIFRQPSRCPRRCLGLTEAW